MMRFFPLLFLWLSSSVMGWEVTLTPLPTPKGYTPTFRGSFGERGAITLQLAHQGECFNWLVDEEGEGTFISSLLPSSPLCLPKEELPSEVAAALDEEIEGYQIDRILTSQSGYLVAQLTYRAFWEEDWIFYTPQEEQWVWPPAPQAPRVPFRINEQGAVLGREYVVEGSAQKRWFIWSLEDGWSYLDPSLPLGLPDSHSLQMWEMNAHQWCVGWQKRSPFTEETEGTLWTPSTGLCKICDWLSKAQQEQVFIEKLIAISSDNEMIGIAHTQQDKTPHFILITLTEEVTDEQATDL